MLRGKATGSLVIDADRGGQLAGDVVDRTRVRERALYEQPIEWVNR